MYGTSGLIITFLIKKGRPVEDVFPPFHKSHIEFNGGLHLDGHINGNVKGDSGAGTFLSVSEHGCIEGSVIAPNVVLNGIVKGDIEASDRVELGAKARVLGNVLYTIIETAVGAQINGKLIHRAVPGQAEPVVRAGPPGSRGTSEG